MTTMINSSVVTVGPFGNYQDDGNHFNDGVGDIVNIVVLHSDLGISALQTTYRKGDEEIETKCHGKEPEAGKAVAKEPGKVKLKFPAEYLVLVQGTYGTIKRTTTEGKKVDYYPCVTSLTFVTNYQSHGPFGVPEGTPFQSPPHSKVMGFSGTSGQILDSIHIFTKPYSRYIVKQVGCADKIVEITEISVDKKSDTIEKAKCANNA